MTFTLASLWLIAAPTAPPDLPLLPPPEKAKPALPPPEKPLLPPPPAQPAQPPLPPGAIEIAPPPRVPGPPFAIAAVKNGFQISLNRRTAELLGSAIDRADEKELAATLRKMAEDQKGANADEKTVATLEMIAFLVQTQLPGFKKALAEQMGPGGVVITLTGFQTPTVKFKQPRPRLQKAAEVVRGVMPLLPDDARGTIEGLRAMARTTPIMWKVEPRE